ncbi:UNVERIFIED_CONTAM: putative plant SNARE 13 [Sesamum indicum]
MANLELQMNTQMEQIHGEIRDTMRALANGFGKLDKIKDPSRQSKQLEDLTGKMRECKRLIKDFDREIKDEESRNRPEVNKQLNDEKQSMIKELNSYVALRKTYMSTLGNKRVELFDVGTGASEATADDNVPLASEMSNQELINAGMKTMDETDQAIERSKQVVHQTIEVGTQTATTLKGQTEQMGRIVNELDTIQFSIKKASQLVKEIGRQVATDKCIMLFLFLIVCGVIAIIIVKVFLYPQSTSMANVFAYSQLCYEIELVVFINLAVALMAWRLFCAKLVFVTDGLGLAYLLDCESKQQKHKGYSWIGSTCINEEEIVAAVNKCGNDIHRVHCCVIVSGFVLDGNDIRWGMSPDSVVPLALYDGSSIPG